MGADSARDRLRAWYALAAAGLLLFVVPLIDSFAVTTGYGSAVDDANQHGNFGPLLKWNVSHSGLALLIHGTTFVPFLLAMSLPPVLARLLWRRTVVPRVVTAVGIAGTACFAASVFIGQIASADLAGRYVAATPTETTVLASTFAARMVFQNSLAYGAGGTLLATYLAGTGIRVLRVHAGRWYGCLSLAAGLLLGATAVQYIGSPQASQAPLAPLSVVGLGIWLAGTGVFLWRLAGASMHEAGEPPVAATK